MLNQIIAGEADRPESQRRREKPNASADTLRASLMEFTRSEKDRIMRSLAPERITPWKRFHP
jgi:hypothetical protein